MSDLKSEKALEHELEQYIRQKITEYQQQADREIGNEHSYAEGRRDAYRDILNKFCHRVLIPPPISHTSLNNSSHLYRRQYDPALKDCKENDELMNEDY